MVSADELHDLLLDVGFFALWKLLLAGIYLLQLEVAQETKFMLENEKKGLARAPSTSCCSSHSVYVVVWVVRRVILHNPVHIRKVQASLGHICAYEYPRLALTELKVRCRSLLLLLPAVDIFDWNINVV